MSHITRSVALLQAYDIPKGVKIPCSYLNMSCLEDVASIACFAVRGLISFVLTLHPLFSFVRTLQDSVKTKGLIGICEESRKRIIFRRQTCLGVGNQFSDTFLRTAISSLLGR